MTVDELRKALEGVDGKLPVYVRAENFDRDQVVAEPAFAAKVDSEHWSLVKRPPVMFLIDGCNAERYAS